MNNVLIDWLSFTSKGNNPLDMADLIGLSDLPWQDLSGARGYRQRKYYDGISIHYDGQDNMGVWCEMSGKGCRAFETHSTKDWMQLLPVVCAKYHVTRLDIAYDDRCEKGSGLLDIGTILNDTDSGEWVSKTEYWQTIRSSKGRSCEFGSPQSKVRLRIYDKAAERNIDDEHWVRVELQLRDERASAFLAVMNSSIGNTFAGVVLNYLRFVDPDPHDNNKWRWPMKPYWEKFIEDSKRISLWIAPGTDYNEARCRNFVVNQCGNAIAACIEMYGLSAFNTMINARKISPNPKYKVMVDSYFRQQHIREDEDTSQFRLIMEQRKNPLYQYDPEIEKALVDAASNEKFPF